MDKEALPQEVDAERVKRYLLNLQDRICAELEAFDGAQFMSDVWARPGGGGGDTRVLSGGRVFERAGVNFSHIFGNKLPPSATKAHPELPGRSFAAMGVSVVVHPHNPYIPTSHCNVRFFIAEAENQAPVWWFGGGFDLTPYYGFVEDAQHWHQTAKDACAPFGDEIYPELKARCDDYFYLPHREEPRGVGGVFFDDWQRGGFESAFEFMQSIGNAYMQAYAPIVERRKDTEFAERQRQFQLMRRGRYVEFNLVHDRGTLFGLQSKGRTESILMSMPPNVSWEYVYEPEAGSPEEALYKEFLVPRDWA